MARPNPSASTVSTTNPSSVTRTPTASPRSMSVAPTRCGHVHRDRDPVGPIVHEVPEGVVVARRGQAALGDHEDARAESGHLVEDVARHQHATSPVAELVEQGDHPPPLNGVEPGEWFVEDQDVRVVHQPGRHLHPLAHALGVGAHGFGRRRGRARRRPVPPPSRPSGSTMPWARAAISTKSAADS